MKPSLLNILAPIDFSEAGKNALKVAIDLCKQHNAVLHLLYVLENRYVISSPEAEVNILEMAHIINERARTCLYEKYEEILKEYKLQVQIHMPVGIPYNEICCAADEIPIDLIVMGTHGKSGAREFSVGSTTANVVKNATKPVLTVPANFETSVFREILFPVRPVKGIIDKYQFMQSFLSGVESSVHIANLYLECEVEERLFYNDRKELFEMEPLVNSTGITCSKKLYVCDHFATKVLELSKNLPIDLIIINSCLEYDGIDFFASRYTQQVINQAKIPVLSFRKGFNLFKEKGTGKKPTLYSFNN
ncbi:MAG: universal stress protein [Ferruginibacter sp.]